MFRLDDIIERWAELYKPLSHVEKDKERTFFRIGQLNAENYFMRNFSSQKSPCMAYVTHIKSEVSKRNNKVDTMPHLIYILVRQENQKGRNNVTDEDAVTEARYRAADIAADLRAFLRILRSAAAGKALSTEQKESLSPTLLQLITETVSDPQYVNGIRGIQLDTIQIQTLPVALNGWHIAAVDFERYEPQRLCLNAEKYR